MATEPTQIDATEVYRALGRLEGEQVQTNERITRLEARLDQVMARHEEHNDRQFARLEARLDRLMFGMFGFGATIIAAVVASIVITLLGG